MDPGGLGALIGASIVMLLLGGDYYYRLWLARKRARLAEPLIIRRK